MEGKTGFELLDSYVRTILNKAMDQYREEKRLPKLVYKGQRACYLFQYDIDGLHLYYDNIKDNCYISIEDLFVNYKKINGVVYLEKYLTDRDNKSGRYSLKCIDTTDSGTNSDTFQINYVNGLPNIMDSTYLPLVDLKPGERVDEYSRQYKKLNPDIEAVLDAAIMNTAQNVTKIKNKYQEALKLIQAMREIAEKKINKSMEKKEEEPER